MLRFVRKSFVNLLNVGLSLWEKINTTVGVLFGTRGLCVKMRWRIGLYRKTGYSEHNAKWISRECTFTKPENTMCVMCESRGSCGLPVSEWGRAGPPAPLSRAGPDTAPSGSASEALRAGSWSRWFGACGSFLAFRWPCELQAPVLLLLKRQRNRIRFLFHS